jgi:hypothetical protein
MLSYLFYWSLHVSAFVMPSSEEQINTTYKRVHTKTVSSFNLISNSHITVGDCTLWVQPTLMVKCDKYLPCSLITSELLCRVGSILRRRPWPRDRLSWLRPVVAFRSAGIVTQIKPLSSPRRPSQLICHLSLYHRSCWSRREISRK